jgi:hypothetical protein
MTSSSFGSSFTTTRRALIAGQRVRLTLLRRRLRAEAERGRARIYGFMAVGVGVGALVFVIAAGGAWFVVRAKAPELIVTGTVAALSAVALALVFSSLGHAAQAFFSAKDLWLWEAAPTGPVARFIDRCTETAMAALPPTLALGTLGVVGLQLGGGGGLWAALRAVLAVFVVAPIPVALGVILAHLGGAFLPAGRLRRLSMVILGVALTVVLVWFRRLRVERLLTEEGAAQLLGDARGISTMGPWFLPPRQLATFVVEGDVAALGVGVAGVAVAVVVAFVVHVGLYRRARKLAVDESPTGVLQGSLMARTMRLLTSVISPDLRPMVEKDLLAFMRDPGQWGQVILLAGVGVLYVVNAAALGDGLRQLGPVGRVLLTSMHAGIVTFIAGGLSARFAFPQMGLEGPAVWIVDGAPMSPRRLLRAKWISALPVAAIFPGALAVAGAVVLDLGVVRVVWTSASIMAFAVLLAGLGVARGAVSPLFDAASLSELAMGPGAMATVIQSTVFSGALAVAVAVADGLVFGLNSGRVDVVTAVGGTFVAIAAPTMVLWITVRRAFAAAEDGFMHRRLLGEAPRQEAPRSLESLD